VTYEDHVTKRRPVGAHEGSHLGIGTYMQDPHRGGPGNPLSDEELATKFHLNATRTLPEARATELATRTLTLPEATSLTPLTTLLPPGDGR
jgi:hypothetical protein